MSAATGAAATRICATLATDASVFPEFKAKTDVATLFLRVADHFLVLRRGAKQDQADTWGVPGGKNEGTETKEETLVRELVEETGIKIEASDCRFHETLYGRIPGWDYKLHLFSACLQERPKVTLSDEHTEARWVNAVEFGELKLLTNQLQAFHRTFPDLATE